ncbi:cupredoxin domain-containing protein [Nitriliruptor alkaliphilus]|uniref:cupredoxin domain-containing protein n=1 Tax=Nitriliruptor alkaliphilus TaxID=427918 RepID=UPI0006975305|nr:cupredoxin domain-containing protein [Nitriliruptor alkaliphilus]
MAAIIERPDPAPLTDDPSSPGGDRFVATSLFLLAGVLLGFQVLISELIPPLVVTSVMVVAFGTALLRRRRRWLLITVIVVAVLQLAGSMPFIVSNLAHPESPLSFIVEAFTVLATLSAALGAAAGLRGAATGSRRPIAVGAGGLALIAVVVSLFAASGVGSDTMQVGDVTIEAEMAHFPEHVEVPVGAAIYADNRDPVRHTLVIEGTDVHVEMPASTAVRVEADLAPGTYRYFCDVPGHERMEGQLDVG